MSRRSGEPAASRWPCPTTSSSDTGRIRTASGAGPAAGAESAPSPDRSKRPSDIAQAYHGLRGKPDALRIGRSCLPTTPCRRQALEDQCATRSMVAPATHANPIPVSLRRSNAGWQIARRTARQPDGNPVTPARLEGRPRLRTPCKTTVFDLLVTFWTPDVSVLKPDRFIPEQSYC